MSASFVRSSPSAMDNEIELSRSLRGLASFAAYQLCQGSNGARVKFLVDNIAFEFTCDHSENVATIRNLHTGFETKFEVDDFIDLI